MIVQTVEQMEKIVLKNKNLIWKGWQVFNIQKSEKAQTSKNGMYINGNWYIAKEIELSRDGWNVPERFVLGHAQT